MSQENGPANGTPEGKGQYLAPGTREKKLANQPAPKGSMPGGNYYTSGDKKKNLASK